MPMYPQNYESSLGFHGNWFISRRENIKNHYITGKQTCDLFTPSGPCFDVGCNQYANKKPFSWNMFCNEDDDLYNICANCSCACGCRCDDDYENTNYTHDTSWGHVHRPPELNLDTTAFTIRKLASGYLQATKLKEKGDGAEHLQRR